MEIQPLPRQGCPGISVQNRSAAEEYSPVLNDLPEEVLGRYDDRWGGWQSGLSDAAPCSTGGRGGGGILGVGIAAGGERDRTTVKDRAVSLYDS